MIFAASELENCLRPIVHTIMTLDSDKMLPCSLYALLLHCLAFVYAHTGPSHMEYSTATGATGATTAAVDTAASRDEQTAASKEHRSASATAEISEIDRCATAHFIRYGCYDTIYALLNFSNPKINTACLVRTTTGFSIDVLCSKFTVQRNNSACIAKYFCMRMSKPTDQLTLLCCGM
jgi:hypothetical protein